MLFLGTSPAVRRLACCIAIAVAICACAGPAQESPASARVAAILLVNVGEQVQAAPPTEPFATAYSNAMALAKANPDDLGYPWFDPSSRELVVSAATQRGRDLLEAAPAGVATRIRVVPHSLAELDRIQEDVTHLRSQGVPGADLIYEVLPDHRDNRTLLVIKSPSQPLLDALIARFPPDALAIEVNPTGA